MTFEEAWDGLTVGDRVTVSDGTAAVPDTAGLRYFMWRSHNHEGELVEKLDGVPRALRIRLDKVGGAQVSYDVAEDVPHTFEAA